MSISSYFGKFNKVQWNAWKLPQHVNSEQYMVQCINPTKSCQAGIWNPLRWRHNDHAGVSNHQPHGCLYNRLFRRTSKKTSKLRVTGLCAGNSPGTGEFPAQMASYAENVSIWWRHHALKNYSRKQHHPSDMDQNYSGKFQSSMECNINRQSMHMLNSNQLHVTVHH